MCVQVFVTCHLTLFDAIFFCVQNFLFKSPKEDSALKATDFGLSDYIRPGTAIVMPLSLNISFASGY